MATATFSIPLTKDGVRSHLVRIGQWDLSTDTVFVAPALTEPKEGFAQNVVVPKKKYAEGWEPRVEEDGDSATATSAPFDTPNPTERELIEGWQMDADEWAIVGNIRVNRWQGYDGRWLYQYKAELRRRVSADYVDVEHLIAEIKKHRPAKVGAIPKGDVAEAVFLADWQAGKPDGDGTRGIVGRALRVIDALPRHVRALRKSGVNVGTLYVAGMGDLIENCSEHYPQQAFRVQLNLRDQVKVTRRLILKALTEWAPHFERVVVAAVPGNHGEVRRDGKSFTSFADNHDVAIFEQLEEITSANPAAFEHVSFQIPNDRLDLTLDMSGTITTLAHGHQFGRGATPAQKALNWWKDQAHGMQPAGDSQLFVSAHNHHLLVTQEGAKTHVQCPSIDGGSDWYRNMTGRESPPGTLSMVIGKNAGLPGWDHLRVL